MAITHGSYGPKETAKQMLQHHKMICLYSAPLPPSLLSAVGNFSADCHKQEKGELLKMMQVRPVCV
jgi:hypothetical protein